MTFPVRFFSVLRENFRPSQTPGELFAQTRLPEVVLGSIRELGVYFFSLAMKRTLYVPSAPRKTFGAWVCLLAVVTLWAPMEAAAWHEYGMACCEGSMCMAHGHSKTNKLISREVPPGESPMNCEHHGDKGIIDCSLSCGHETSPSVTASVIFVLPNPAAICEPAPALAAPTSLAPTAFVPSDDPLAPPPRTSHFSL